MTGDEHQPGDTGQLVDGEATGAHVLGGHPAHQIVAGIGQLGDGEVGKVAGHLLVRGE